MPAKRSLGGYSHSGRWVSNALAVSCADAGLEGRPAARRHVARVPRFIRARTAASSSAALTRGRCA
eukprot:6179240-Pleurochrysis_carterae.AAC.2